MTRFRSPAIPILALLIALLAAASPLAAAPEGAPSDEARRKIILLGFDGVDFRMAERYIQEGQLPHLAELKEQGAFLPLNTTNPAQSPVAWAAVVTGMNPGKTNIGGFIRRNFNRNMVTPQLATTEDRYGDEEHTVPYSEFSAVHPDSRMKWIGIGAAGFLLVAFLLLKVILRLRVVISFVGAVIVGVAAGAFGFSYFDGVPEKAPFPYNLQQGEPFWEILSREGIRTVGLYAPGAYPVVAAENAEILGGLGVPDVNGGTGTWYVYSSEAFTFFDMPTNTGGKVIRLNEKDGGQLAGLVYGPTNFFRMDQFKADLEKLKARRDSEKLTPEEKTAASKDFDEKDQEYRNWKSEESQKKATLELILEPDFANRSATFRLMGQTKTVKEGEWCDWFKVTFELSPFVKVPALVRMRLIKCSDDEVRFFVPPIDISPESPPPFLRLSSPATYCSDLAAGVGGPFETVGWACITHGLKDEEIDEDVFMEDIEFTMESRLRLMRNQAKRKDWDVFFETFYSTDRVQHMMFRLHDEGHPQHNPQLAKKQMPFFDENITLKDSISETYQAMDTIVGEVMDGIDQGHYGKDPVLMIVSDHGFAPFYWCMGVNNFLVEKGFLTLLPDASGEPRTVDSVIGTDLENYLAYVDWTKTKAYSLGLGKIFINLEGREPKGAVAPADYDKVRDEIIDALMAYEDPNTGNKVMKRVYKRDEIFSGDFWEEGDTEFTFYKPDGERFTEKRYTEGFADLYLGFYPRYRVSWQTSLGGLEEAVIVPNEQKWSGDHVSVDPSEVQGVFFCNRPVKGDRVPALPDIVPTILTLEGVAIPENIDGEAIAIDG